MNAALQLQQMLRAMFQFDDADLDFGIYRMMNRKRTAIETFIHALPSQINEHMQGFSAAEIATIDQDLAKEREKILAVVDEEVAFDAQGKLHPTYATSKSGQHFMQLFERRASAAADAGSVAAVYNDVLTFLDRYYDNGDFITQRRFGSSAAYALPYNGEEVLLHFANRDQYYVKTGERFSAYQWTVSGADGVVYTVRFAVDSAQVAQNNNKTTRQFWLLRDEKPVEYAAEQHTITLHFAYRPLRDGESEGGNAQTQQDSDFAGNRRNGAGFCPRCAANGAE